MPSGHSASAFAFATAVGFELPALSIPLRVVATAVAYSRVHTGVHYPADAMAGSVIGASAAQIVSQIVGGRGRRASGRPLVDRGGQPATRSASLLASFKVTAMSDRRRAPG